MRGAEAAARRHHSEEKQRTIAGNAFPLLQRMLALPVALSQLLLRAFCLPDPAHVRAGCEFPKFTRLVHEIVVDAFADRDNLCVVHEVSLLKI